MRETDAAMRHLEQEVTDAGGITLRYGNFYGPGDEALLDAVRQRRFPLVGDGGGIWSCIHLDDAAAATRTRARTRRSRGLQHRRRRPRPRPRVAAGTRESRRATPPRHVPRWVARFFAGEVAVVMATESRGASNAKAKRELGWTLRHPSWRQGFADAD